MTQDFEGYLFPQGSSDRKTVRVEVSDVGNVDVLDPSGLALLSASWVDLVLSPRVGGSARRLTFPGGELLETRDNDAVDALDKTFRGTTASALAHRMEKLTAFTLVVLTVTGIIAFSFFKWWLPAASDRTAMALPPSLMDGIGHRSLQVMDKSFLDASKLDDEVKQAFRKRFADLVAATDTLEQTPKLLFRSAPALGPNAFALPNGQIVLTDQIVELSTHDSQIIGVLAHEISHVEERHIMRRFLRSTSIAVIIVLITGDMAELTEMAIAIPTFMIEMGYSRAFEHEADVRAITLMAAIGEDPSHLADMFDLMTEECGEDCGSTWLSSHPDTLERIAFIRGKK